LRPYNTLEVTGNDPALTPKSKSVFSDQYDLMQNGQSSPKRHHPHEVRLRLAGFGDELLEWGIFASTENERKEEAQAAK
jgi:hypothetical protein